MDLLNELKMIDAEELIIAMASIVEENCKSFEGKSLMDLWKEWN